MLTQFGSREITIGQFGLLQRQDIRIDLLQPVDDMRQPDPEGINIPGSDYEHESGLLLIP